jgi:hypothetical protein
MYLAQGYCNPHSLQLVGCCWRSVTGC